MMHQHKQAASAGARVPAHRAKSRAAVPGAAMARTGVAPAFLALAVAALLAGCARTPVPGAPTAGGLATSAALVCTVVTNCVSSAGSTELPALRYRGTLEDGVKALKSTLASFPEAQIVRDGALDIGTIFTTASGFRDEVDFRIDPDSGRIDFRSRSLLGLFDFGKNRSRMLDFTARFARQPAAVSAGPG